MNLNGTSTFLHLILMKQIRGISMAYFTEHIVILTILVSSCTFLLTHDWITR